MKIKQSRVNSITKWHTFEIEHLGKIHFFEVKTVQTASDFRILEIHGEKMDKKIKSEMKQLIAKSVNLAYETAKLTNHNFQD